MLSSNNEPSYDETLYSVYRLVALEMNCSSCADFSNEEIKETLFQMNPHTTPGLDGRSFFFFFFLF